MKAYAKEISGFASTVSEADIMNSTNAAKGLVELQNALPSEEVGLTELLVLRI